MLNGLLPRSVMDKYGVNYLYNDENRYDNCKNAVCTSIGFPNYKMFYKYRLLKNKANWIVIVFDSQKILRYPCAFFRTNAGCRDSLQFTQEERQNAQAFEEISNDTVEQAQKSENIQREVTNISDVVSSTTATTQETAAATQVLSEQANNLHQLIQQIKH